MSEVGNVPITCLLFLIIVGALQSSRAYESILEAYPSLQAWTSKLHEPEVVLQQQPKKKILDLTHEMRLDLPVFSDENSLGETVRLVLSMDDGSEYNLSEMKMGVHSGTHLDAPGHFVNEHYKAGFDASGLDLNVLVGPVLIVDTPRDSQITAEVLEKLGIPRGVERVIFRTSNTDRRLMWNPKFDSSYIGITADGAEWLVSHRPEVKLVGSDYISIATFDDCTESHRVLLGKKLILVEGLNLDEVQVGLSNLYCLPLRLLTAEASPCRCILVE